MSTSDFENMSKDQIVDWFTRAPDADLAEVVRTAQRIEEPSTATPAEVSIPLMLTSIRLPVELVRSLDEVAATAGLNRSEAIRLAVAEFVQQRHGGVSSSEAERALDVLRRVVGEHVSSHRDAA